MDNSLKGLILAAGVIITCLVIGLGFYISREAKNTSNNGTSQLNNMASEYQDVTKTIYDGSNISGREVLEAINKLASTNFTINVNTKDGEKKAYTSAITDNKYVLDGKGYINPDGRFLGEIGKDDNNVISEITFTQQ